MSPVSARMRPISALARVVNATVGCQFSIYDNQGGYWDWTYEARLYDPDGNQIQFKTAWVASKTSFSGAITKTLADPEEGTYICRILWWIQDYQVPERTASQTLAYVTPNGEATLRNAWADVVPTACKWRGRLNGGSFAGRMLRELPGGNDVDTCWWPQSEVGNPPAVGGTNGGPWTVDGSNEYGDDIVGWGWQAVDYYQSAGRAPCQYEGDQIMQINRGSQWTTYKVNRLKGGIGVNYVWSYRDGEQESKGWQ